MSLCYQSINPKPYFNECLRNYRENRETSICQASYAYAVHCNAVGVSVKLPRHCTDDDDEEAKMDVMQPDVQGRL